MSVILWVVAGLVSLVVAMRLRPEWVMDVRDELTKSERAGLSEALRMEWDSYYLPYAHQGDRCEFMRRNGLAQWTMDDYFKPVAVVAAWPLMLAGIGLAVFVDANVRAVNHKTKVRAELEKELAAAKKEIDDLLRRE